MLFRPAIKIKSEFILTATVLLSLLPALLRAAEPERWNFIPEPAALWDGQPLGRGEVVTSLRQRMPEESWRRMTPDELLAAARRQVDQLIGRRLLEQMIAAAGISVTGKEIAARFDELVAHMTPVQHEMLLARWRREKISFRDFLAVAAKDKDTRFELALRRLIALKFPGRLAIGDDRCEAYYRENQTLFERPVRLDVSRIYLSFAVEKQRLHSQHPDWSEAVLTQRSERNVRQKIGMIAQLARSGDFAALARQYSDCPSAANGGRLGSFARTDDIDPAMAKVIFALAPGMVGEAMAWEGGYQLLRVNRVVPAGYAPLAEVVNFIREDLQGRLMAELAARLVREERGRHRIVVNF
ncbi:MAG: peptidylprolyl isomerase [Victivallales bacterium]|nr:peptidylprolyl isomerase [Victivallales bacterium]